MALACTAVLALWAGPASAQFPIVLRGCNDSGLPNAQVPGVDPRGADPGSPNPLTGLRFFIDPTEPAFQDLLDRLGANETGRAALIGRLAWRARFRWVGRWGRPDMQAKVRDSLRCVQSLEPGSVPLMTVMRHQGRACGPNSLAGGSAEDARTR